MNVLFISSWFPSGKFPFNGNFVIRHAEAVAQYHSVTVLHVTSDPLVDKSALGIDPALNFMEVDFRSSEIPFMGNLINRIRTIQLYLKAVKKLVHGDNKPDIIHVNVIYPIGIIAVLLKWRFRIPFIITEHWTGYLKSRSTQISVYRKFITKIICNQSSFICPVSENLALSMQILGFKGNYKVIGNVVNTELFNNQVVFLNHEVPQLVHISSLDEDQKNIKGLLRVIMRMLNSYRFDFHLISDNSFDWVHNFRKEIGLTLDHVHLHGPFTPMQIASFLAKSDLLVLFSRYENLPCVIAESLVAGTPVISSDVGGIKEMIGIDNGRLVASEDEEALFNQLSCFITKKIVFNRHKIKQDAEKKYSYKSVGLEFTNIYKSVVKDLFRKKRNI